MTEPALPADQPRYLMGVGTPVDLIENVARGIDMFDCVLPTRNGRHGMAFTRHGAINLGNARHANDPRPLDAESPHPVARTYSRAYLHHLIRSGELLGMMLLWHARPDAENMAIHAEATFWYVLPSLPMFLLIPALLRSGVPFWLALGLGCLLTLGLYLAMTHLGKLL